MALDPGQLVSSMLAAALAVLKKSPEIVAYPETEFKKIADTVNSIGPGPPGGWTRRWRMYERGQVTEEGAKLHLQSRANASRAVLLTDEGLGLLAAEQAMNAAISAVRDTVNAALPFKLL